jgi:hypothetical protein
MEADIGQLPVAAAVVALVGPIVGDRVVAWPSSPPSTGYVSSGRWPFSVLRAPWTSYVLMARPWRHAAAQLGDSWLAVDFSEHVVLSGKHAGRRLKISREP